MLMSSEQTNGSILLVEDDRATYTAMSLLLEHYNYHVLHARTVAEAIDLLKERPNYLFLDLMLPDGDGTRVLEQVRKQKLPVTVAVISGTTDPRTVRRVQVLHPEVFLRKPLDFLALLSQLRSGELPPGPIQ